MSDKKQAFQLWRGLGAAVVPIWLAMDAGNSLWLRLAFLAFALAVVFGCGLVEGENALRHHISEREKYRR